MKRIICLLLVLCLAVPLTSCVSSKSFINGVNLRDYSIVYSKEDLDYAKRAAYYIQSEIYDRTGLTLPVIEDSYPTWTKNEIVVGNTNRSISGKLNAETEGFEFAILADHNSIALEADYFIIAAAAYFFIETYVPTDDYEATVPKETVVHKPIVKEARNFILLIGDGMGYYQTKLFEQIENDLEYSDDGEQIFYGSLFPYSGYSRTDSLSGTTDSAAGGTALSCGTKTVNGYVGQNGDGNDIKNMTELAYELGKSAGVMSTENNTGATPSTFCSHAASRNDSSDIRKSQLYAKQTYGTLIDCGFDYYSADGIHDIEMFITDNLKTLEKNDNGFFLMYEEAYIDKHCHNNNIEKAFKAIVRFNQAIGRFMEYAFYNPDTFVLITADHETGGLAPDENKVLTFSTGNHTGANVPIFAYGQGAELFDGKEIENIQIAHTIAALMGEENFGDQSVYQSLTKYNVE